MIAMLIGAAIAQTQIRFSVLELPDPQADRVAIHAYLWRDGRYAQEEAAWRILGACLGQNSKTFSTGDVGFFGSLVGVRPRIAVAPDFIRIEIVAPPDKWRDSLTLAASLLAEPNWRSNQWEEKEKFAAGTSADIWRDLLWPPADFKQRLEPDSLPNCHARNMDASGIRIVVAGPVEVGQARDALAVAAKSWPLPEFRKVSRYSDPVAPPDRSGTGATTYEMATPPIRVGETGSEAQFLAAVALGVGKGSAIWERLREKEGLAYRVEGLFWPSRKGFIPRFLMIRRSEANELVHAGTMSNGLKEAAKDLSLLDLERAKGMARQILLHPNAFPSVFLDSETALYGDRDDDTRWRGLLNGMGLPSIPLQRWVEALDGVSEEDFRNAAIAMLENASIHVTRGVPGGLD